ncbi:MAG: TatD family hydrolase [Proteobacteria bacterium]|nr:TatD family hydrolase [Pseudomonadota bacterium]
MKKIDIHCHVDLYSDDELETIFGNEDYLVIGAATGYESGNRLLRLAEDYRNLNVCLGIHPEFPEEFSDFERVAGQIEENRERIVAIGEIGLPWYCLKKMDDRQKKVTARKAEELLVRFMGLAREYDLPLILHSIENMASLALDELKKNGIQRALFHWFEGSKRDLERIVEEGFMVSVSPDLLHNNRYAEFTDDIPMEILTLESDGPWEYDGVRGVPSMIEDTAAYLAARRNLKPEEILAASYANSTKLFGQLPNLPLASSSSAT